MTESDKQNWPEWKGEPRTSEQDASIRKEMVEKTGITKFTCDNCNIINSEKYCVYRWDSYNTNGDCLALK